MQDKDSSKPKVIVDWGLASCPPELNAPSRRSGKPQPIRVFIAEDHTVTLYGLEKLFESSKELPIDVVGTAATRDQLINHPSLPLADIVLLDLDLGGQDSTVVMPDVLTRTSAKIILFTGDTHVERHREAVLRGARGVLLKSEPAEVLLRAIDKVHQGEIWLHRILVGDVLDELTGQTPPRHRKNRLVDSLTPREREIVETLARNAGAKLLSVASDLHMSENTLRNHLTTIYSKLGVHGRLELHVFATEHGLIRSD